MKKILFAIIVLLLAIKSQAQTLTIKNNLLCPVSFNAWATGSTSSCTATPFYETINFTLAGGSSMTLNMSTMSPSQWMSYPGTSGYWTICNGGSNCNPGATFQVTDPCFSPMTTCSMVYNCSGPCFNYAATITWTGSGSTAATVTIN